MKIIAIGFVATVLCAATWATPLPETHSEIDQMHQWVFDTLNPVTPISDYPLKLQCLKKICVNVSEEYRVGEIWRKYETYMNNNLENMKSCPQLDNGELIRKCYQVKMFSGDRILLIFYVHLLDFHYKAAIQLRYKYYNDCNMKTEFGEFGPRNRNPSELSPARLICIKGAIDKVMKENGLEDQWEEYQKELIVVLAAIDACNDIEDPAEAEECTKKQTQKGARIIQKFMTALLINGQYDIIQKIGNQVAADCADVPRDALSIFPVAL